MKTQLTKGLEKIIKLLILPIFISFFTSNIKADEIPDYTNLYIEQPVLPPNIHTLFAYISLSKHDNDIKKLLVKIAKNTGDNNGVMYLGKQTKDLDKYLDLIKCDLLGKEQPIIVIEEKTGAKSCYFFYPNDISDVYIILSKYKEYLKGNDEALAKLKFQDWLKSFFSENKSKLNSQTIEGLTYLASLIFEQYKK